MTEEKEPVLLAPSQPGPITGRVLSITEKQPKKMLRARKPKPQSFTLAEAFTYEQNSSQKTLDLQKAIYSISFLMQYFSEIGNEDPEGMLINGLTYALEKIAREIGDLFVW